MLLVVHSVCVPELSLCVVVRQHETVCDEKLQDNTYIQVLVHVEVDVIRAAVWVGDLEQVRASLCGQGCSGRVGAARNEEPVVGCNLADGGDRGLDSISPG